MSPPPRGLSKHFGEGDAALTEGDSSRRWDEEFIRRRLRPEPAADDETGGSSRPMSATTATTAHASPTDRFVRSVPMVPPVAATSHAGRWRVALAALERSFEATRLPMGRAIGQPGGELGVVVLGHRIGSEAAVGEGCEPASASRIARAP